MNDESKKAIEDGGLTECEVCGEYLPESSFKLAAAIDGWGDEPCCDECFYKSQRDAAAINSIVKPD